jgi:peptidoglycan/xylan/chitin deacetylase (PgdA/CDA1 family)
MSARAGVAFAFDGPAWERAEAVHASSVLASLLELPVRLVPAGAGAAEHEAVVHVGDPERVPEHAAAVIPCTAWDRWVTSEVSLAPYETVALPAPGGDLGPRRSERHLPDPWLRSAAWMLQREEETQETHRDEWGCFSGFSSRLHELGAIDTPVVNRMIEPLERRVRAWFERRHLEPPSRPRWKHGARFAVALTHDVDAVRYFSVREGLRLLRRARGPRSYAFRRGLAQVAESLFSSGRGGDPFWTFDRWVAEEERHGFRSTYFFLPSSPARVHEYDGTYAWDDPVAFQGRRGTVRDLMRGLASRGHEIGLHAAYLSHRDGDELRREKHEVEEALGAPVAGLRQHFLRFDIEATWAAQQQAGFAYDATLGFNEALGFRAGVAAPFRPWRVDSRSPAELLELPLTVMDGVLFRTLKLDRDLATRRVRRHLDAVEACGGLAVLLWHPNAADASRYPGWFEAYAEILEELAARRAWVATAGEVAAWWSERSRQG